MNASSIEGGLLTVEIEVQQQESSEGNLGTYPGDEAGWEEMILWLCRVFKV